MKNKNGSIFIGILIVVSIGLLLPFVLSFFIDVDSVSGSPITNTTASLIDNGVSFGNITLWGITVVPEVSLNPFNLLGATLKAYITDSVLMFGIFPTSIVAFFMILIITLLGVGLLKLIRG